MQVKLFMAQSINAKIAREDGSEDFLSSRNWKEFKEIAEKAGNFLVGRKTYEAVKEWKDKGFKDIEAERLVLSSKASLELDEGFNQVRSPEKAVELAETEDAEALLVTGGASVNSSFMEKGLIDEIVLDIEPYVLGEGLNLFSEAGFEAELELEEVEELEEGIVQMVYTV